MKSWMCGALIAGMTFSAVGAQATGTLQQLDLPAVEKAPWRFKQFPILAWWGPPGSASQKDFNNYRDAGINIYLANPDTEFKEAMQKATAAGLAIMPFRDKQGFGLKKDDIKLPKDHPNVVGWIASDEPGSIKAVTKSITVMNRLMRKDPTRWTLFNCLPPGIIKEATDSEVIAASVRNGMRVISYDNYVIHGDGTTGKTAHFANVEFYRKESLKHNVPFWAFALTIQHFHYRRPSESDVRWKQFTNLAYGAKGLWYFTYWGPTDWDNWDNWDNKAIVNPADGSKTELYGYVKAINDNVQSVGNILLNLTNETVMHTSDTPTSQTTFEKNKYWIADVQARKAIVSLFRHKDGTQYAMIVNKRHGKDKSAADVADTMTITFAPEVKSVEAVAWLDGKTGPLRITDHKTTMTIAGGTGVLLKATLQIDRK